MATSLTRPEVISFVWISRIYCVWNQHAHWLLIHSGLGLVAFGLGLIALLASVSASTLWPQASYTWWHNWSTSMGLPSSSLSPTPSRPVNNTFHHILIIAYYDNLTAFTVWLESHCFNFSSATGCKYAAITWLSVRPRVRHKGESLQ